MKKFWNSFKKILKALISNRTCIEEGKYRPWYYAVPMGVIAVVLSIIPILVNTINTQGSSFLSSSSYLYGYDLAVQRFAESIRDNNVNITVNQGTESKIFYCDEATWNATYTTKDGRDYNCYQHKNSSDVIDFEAYYFPTYSNDILSNILANVKNEDGTFSNRKNSFLLITDKYLISYMYNLQSDTRVGGVVGDPYSFEIGYNMQSIGDVVGRTDPDKYNEYRNGVLNNWKAFYDTCYLCNHNNAIWQQTLLVTGIDVAVLVFMGFMLWLLTRGKTNPFRTFSFWDTQKMGYWASLTPGILALIVGFIFSNFAMMAFPLILGLRIMWMSMKNLKPDYQPSQAEKDRIKKQQAKNAKTVTAKKIK